MASRIEDYGLIGDTKTAALVAKDGAIDWFCAPRFDSDACFSALVGNDEHGRWVIQPTVSVRKSQQRYREDTVIIETQLECDGGVIRIVDFMPMAGSRTEIVRIVEGVEGKISMEMFLNPKFGYGARKPLIRARSDADANSVVLQAGPEALCLRSPVKLEIEENHVAAVFDVKKGDRLSFTLSWYPSHEDTPPALNPNDALTSTERFWTEWAGRCSYRGRWREQVVRSLITLKALTYAPTGGIVAAATTSLPEEIGGVRNWDYRFCWLRDATLTLVALMIGGYSEEAAAWRTWLKRAVAGDPAEMQIMYGVAGERRLTEYEVDWLPGYEASRPVRIGNAASNQFQLDVYGEVLGCMYLARKMGLPALDDPWMTAKKVIQHLQHVWQDPDEGIWEVRGGGRRHFTYSKVMAWVAFDRAVRLMEDFGAGGESREKALPHLRALRERIHREICTRAFNEKIGAFTQYYGGTTLDASVLLMPHVQFLPADDPRMKSTVRAIETSLVRDGFVQRYSTDEGVDGLPGSEGAFLACSFWLADNYAFQGRIKEAEDKFERLLSLCNPLGLLAEEYEPNSGRLIGNFPQAFSHLAVVSTAWLIDSHSTKKKSSLAPRGKDVTVNGR